MAWPGAGESGITPEQPQNPRKLRAVEPAEAERAPRSPERPPHNLPSELSSFVGREKELPEVRRLLENNRLLTLTGPGGCGKSRLALAAASELVQGFEDGVWMVELASLAELRSCPRRWPSLWEFVSGRETRLPRLSPTTSEPGSCCYFWTTVST